MSEDRPAALADDSFIHSDPEILGGTPVFVGTRVPVQTLVDYLEGGYSVDEFLDNYPSVRRKQVNAFLEEATRALPQVASNDLAASCRDMAADEDREAEAHEWAEATARDIADEAR